MYAFSHDPRFCEPRGPMHLFLAGQWCNSGSALVSHCWSNVLFVPSGRYALVNSTWAQPNASAGRSVGGVGAPQSRCAVVREVVDIGAVAGPHQIDDV